MNNDDRMGDAEVPDHWEPWMCANPHHVHYPHPPNPLHPSGENHQS